jgi:hypothetical protein
VPPGADDDPLVAGSGVGASLSSERVGRVLDAYADLAQGNAEPLVALLDGNVEWLEWRGIREARRVVGAEPVARILRECARGHGRLECTGAAKVGTDCFAIEFSEPWWTERRRRLAALLPRDSFQVLTVGPLIERIESHSAPAPAGEGEP